MANFILPYEPQYKRHRGAKTPAGSALQRYERKTASPSIVPVQLADKAEAALAPPRADEVSKR